VRADERRPHAVRHRGDDVAGNVVADEQHLSCGASGRRQYEVVEDRVGFPAFSELMKLRDGRSYVVTVGI
jgi:hypothetical protein